MIRRWTFAALGALLLTLAACSSTPQVQQYLLSAPELSAISTSEPNASGAKIVIGQVEVAAFLSGQSIVTMQDGHQLHQAHYHRWAEPLPRQLQRQLRLGLAAQLPNHSWLSIHGSAHLRSLDYRLDIVVDEFHLNSRQQAVVGGQWQLRDANQGYVAHGQFHQYQGLSADGYPALVEALNQAWQQSLVEIAEQLTHNGTLQL
ncbi:PqiC family protein [Aliidiomarina maris]|uniref:ABC-type transport auxiliary lipoprotein component domain-containing protein n=1 Tax=Aliidiomarina maris TaxID=531312 RepID=A0A327X7E1_9GAMM|nr:PqiC family protein [Aliidiomarina maris]MBA3989236.1 hypothetical protein [Idiomarina sp.]RAJ99086.1 hypothetical protein B0I24_10380 [Aliidiomarina maris]RUO27753.1 hypothetical protein CWE07_03840 [Aliidiomarina maris]